MQKELKIRIDDPKNIEGKLIQLGYPIIEQRTSGYTYFNQPENKILKISENDQKSFLIYMEKVDERFALKKKDLIRDLDQTKKSLRTKHGVKRVVTNQRTFFEHPYLKVSLNKVEKTGTFLILEGEDPTISFVTDILEVSNPQVVTESFDNL